MHFELRDNRLRQIEVYRVDATVRQEGYIEYEYWGSVPADK